MMNLPEYCSVLIYDSKGNTSNHLVSTLKSIPQINKLTYASSMEEITSLLATETPSISFSLFILTMRNEFMKSNQPYGLQIYRIIRSFPLHKTTPIILIAALQNDEYPELIYEHFYDVWDIGYSSEYAIHSVTNALLRTYPYNQNFFYCLSRGQKMSGFTLCNLIYINHSYRNATFYTLNSVIENMNISCEENLKNLYHFGFRRCNRFQIVNLFYIHEIKFEDGSYKLILKDCDVILSIGKPFYEDIIQSFSLISTNEL